MTDNRPEQFFGEILALLDQPRPFALATVVHTSGSTPQKAGARALFLPDGRVLGTLGGGCMEAESRRRALELISGPASPERSNAQPPEHLLLDLHLDDDFGWDDGLICGGSAQIFIQPLCSADLPVGEQAGRKPGATMGEVVEPEPAPTPNAQRPTPDPQPPTPNPHAAYAAAIALKDERRRGMLAMVVEAPSPADIGRTLLVPEEGPMVGALKDAALAEEVTATARRLLEEGGEAPRRLRLSEGAATLYLEPVLPRPVLLIMGAGHVGTALTHYASRIGFEVVVVDDRASFANRERLPDADQVIVDSVVEVARRWPKTPETYVVLVTRGHRNDAVTLRELIGAPCAYVGMIGSRRKVLTIYEEFLAEGIATPEQLARVHAPIGLDIGALTVDEIALSIAAELIAVRRQGSGVRGQGSERQGSEVRGQGSGQAEAALPELTPDPSPLTPGAERHANSDCAGGGGVPADGDAEAALAVRQRERDRTGRPLAASLPDRRRAGSSGPPRP
jgi:xanthine dehydrogenase accessory factor